MRFIKISCLVVMFSLLPKSAFACEPLLPLVMIFGFPFYSLFGVVLIKSLAFVWFEKSLPWNKAIGYMVVANLFSSLIGLCLSLGAAVPTFMIFVLVFVFALTVFPAKRFVKENPWGILSNWKPWMLAVIVTGLYFLTFVLFMIAQLHLEKATIVQYWVIKYLYVLSAIIISIALTTFWEEWAIVKISKNDGNYMTSVLKANLVAFLVIMAILAAIALPKRMRSKDFLIMKQNPTDVARTVDMQERKYFLDTSLQGKPEQP